MSESIKQIMFHVFQNDPSGIKVFEYLTSRFYDTTVFKANDPYTTAYNAGQHDLILHLINMMATTEQLKQENENE